MTDIMRHPAKIDIAVLMLFFNRPDTFGQVFAEVKKARPSRLFLYQDGPRDDKDMDGIMACRRIAEDIDWECDVRQCYQERNYGCDPSGYMSQKWAFSLASKCMVLEDDVVPSQSFFPFCKEMLDRYEHDERVTMVAGFNVDEVSAAVPYDYFFTSAFSIWGWASWRRVVDQWDATYSFLDDSFNMLQLRAVLRQRGFRRDFIKMCRDHRQAGKPFFESVFWSAMLFGSGLAIMPSKNLVSNIGLTENSTHYASDMRTTPHGLRRIFTMGRHDIDFPLRHPKYVIEYVDYKDRLYRVNAWGHPLVKAGRSVEEFLLSLRYGQFGKIGKAIRLRVSKWMGRAKHV